MAQDTDLAPLIAVGAFLVLIGIAMGAADLHSAIVQVHELPINSRQLVKIGLVVFAIAALLWGVLE